jgi:hypothetical protein
MECELRLRAIAESALVEGLTEAIEEGIARRTALDLQGLLEAVKGPEFNVGRLLEAFGKPRPSKKWDAIKASQTSESEALAGYLRTFVVAAVVADWVADDDYSDPRVT